MLKVKYGILVLVIIGFIISCIKGSIAGGIITFIMFVLVCDSIGKSNDKKYLSSLSLADKAKELDKRRKVAEDKKAQERVQEQTRVQERAESKRHKETMEKLDYIARNTRYK